MKKYAQLAVLALVLAACNEEAADDNTTNEPLQTEQQSDVTTNEQTNDEQVEETEEEAEEEQGTEEEGQEIDEQDAYVKELYANVLQGIEQMTSWEKVRTANYEEMQFHDETFVDYFIERHQDLIQSPASSYLSYRYTGIVAGQEEPNEDVYEQYNVEDVAYKFYPDGTSEEIVSLPLEYKFYMPAIQEMAMNALLSATSFDTDYREDGLEMLVLTHDEVQWGELFEMMQYRYALHLTEEEITDDHWYLLNIAERIEFMQVVLLYNPMEQHFAGYQLYVDYAGIDETDVNSFRKEERYYSINGEFDIVIP